MKKLNELITKHRYKVWLVALVTGFIIAKIF